MLYIKIVGKKQKSTYLQKVMAVWPVMIFVLVAGVSLGVLWQAHGSLSNNRNTVVINDPDVKVPASLVAFLKNQSYCNGTKSTGIWSIYQAYQGKFAKIAYGCGTSLDSYAMAIQSGKSWTLLMPKQYLLPAKASGTVSGYGPSCELVTKYNISKQIEPVCVNGKGQSKVVSVP